MAPLPPEGTPRFRFEYTVNGDAHDFQVRSNQSPAALGALVDTALTALSPNMYLITIGTVNFAASGSNIFLPVTSGIEGNTYGSGTGVYQERPAFIGFAGRTSAGRKWRLDVYGPRNLAGDFRYLPNENAAVSAFIHALQAWPSGALQGIDGENVTVYEYANAALNAYWQRHLRP